MTEVVDGMTGVGVGDAAVSDIAKWNPVAAEFKANAETAEVYRRQCKVFRELYERNKDLIKILNAG